MQVRSSACEGAAFAAMKDFHLDELTIRAEPSAAGHILVRWTGQSISRTPGASLRPFFDELLTQAATEKAAVKMHFEDLEHFNSSTISALMQLINSAQAKGVQLQVIYDGTVKWQALSFDALRRALRPFEGAQNIHVEFVSSKKTLG